MLINSDHIDHADNVGTRFTFTSGLVSPVYVNMRAFLGRAQDRDALIRHAIHEITKIRAVAPFDVIAGGETAGIPYAAILADRLNCGFAYVRKKTKGFGQNRLVEGLPVAGKRVLLVEDLTTDGKSKIGFARTIREEGGMVSHVFSAFYYGLDKVTEQIFADADLHLHYLCAWRDVLATPQVGGRFSNVQIAEIRAFIDAANDPATATNNVGIL